MSSGTDLGRVAYQGYAQQTKGRTYNDLPMPRWEELGEQIQQAWRVAAMAVVAVVTKEERRG